MLIGLIKLVVLITKVNEFSLLPFRNFDHIGSVLWHSDKNSDDFSGLGGRGGVLLEKGERSRSFASGIWFIDGEDLRKVGHLAGV